MLYNPDVLAQWHDMLTAGVVSMCAITELELLYTARSKAYLRLRAPRCPKYWRASTGIQCASPATGAVSRHGCVRR